MTDSGTGDSPDRTTISVSRAVHQALKIQAAMSGRTIADLADEVLGERCVIVIGREVYERMVHECEHHGGDPTALADRALAEKLDRLEKYRADHR